MQKEGRDPYLVACGKRLRWAREAKGYDRAALARYLFDPSTDADLRRAKDNVKTWELGIAQMPARYADRLKRLFGIDPNWIFSGDASRMDADLAARVLDRQQREALNPT